MIPVWFSTGRHDVWRPFLKNHQKTIIMKKIEFTGALFVFHQGTDKWSINWKKDPTNKEFPWIAYVDKNNLYQTTWNCRQAPTRTGSLTRIRHTIREQQSTEL